MNRHVYLVVEMRNCMSSVITPMMEVNMEGNAGYMTE